MMWLRPRNGVEINGQVNPAINIDACAGFVAENETIKIDGQKVVVYKIVFMNASGRFARWAYFNIRSRDEAYTELLRGCNFI